MKRIMNITTYPENLAQYHSREELRAYYRGFGLDGLEVVEAGEDTAGILGTEDVIGVHLRFFSCWYCLWTGDTQSLLEEFGSWEEVERQFGGTDREALLRAFRKNLEFARKYHPQYAVFHVSDVFLSEIMTRKFRYSDEEIIDAAAEIVNQVYAEDEGFELLFENLWWPGLTMTRPEITERLLKQIRYPRKGIMLDVGHLMHTNTALRTLDEAADYVREVVGRYQDRSIIRGLHFHQTLSGAYVEDWKKHPLELSGSYDEKSMALKDYFANLDSHRPFTGRTAEELISWLAPEYLVYELSEFDRTKHEALMREITGQKKN